MITTTLHYPGDPPQVIFLMFGKEFVEKIRGEGSAHVTVHVFEDPPVASIAPVPSKSYTYEVKKIICDQCGGEIKSEEPLAFGWAPSKVYCWPCHTTLNGPYVVGKR